MKKNINEVVTFWRRMMDRWQGEEAYNRSIVESFKGSGDPDILIVVDKLLTGFDAPRNTVLYMARPLREHGLLQAIARVNRVFDGRWRSGEAIWIYHRLLRRFCRISPLR